METTIAMDTSGRMVIPKEVRRRLNLRGGAQLRAAVVAGRIELTPVEDDGEDGQLTRKQGIAVLKRTGNQVDTAAAIEEERNLQAGRGVRR